MFKKFKVVLLVFCISFSLLACTPRINSTPENAVLNFIDAGLNEKKEVFKEILDLPQDEDAFVESYIKIYTDYKNENNIKIEDIQIRLIPEGEFVEGVLKDMEEQQGFSPIIVEVTNLDPQPLLFLLKKENDKYYIRNIDTKERYKDIFK
ncbi:MAG: hypothetical protein K0R93_531 [Anaerosolibacter sp.]|jgi:hypothetical protein|uniref:hypothetical protein n=1 Tax=Anaerosolibacter sp. TaxID=1872527 RepID=UPI0026318ED6|nr:hypothetical protein [Anaerosolibacter sp.]MDF2545633.1 hypothetical protein [Anaerosolibacter sp.]